MKFLTVLVSIVLLFGIGYGQQKVESLDVIQPEFTTVTLDSTATSSVYYIFPPPAGINSGNRTAISTTAPTSASAQAKNLEFNASGALTISIVTDTLTAEESDSLYVSVASLIYDDNKATWYASNNDVFYLDLDTQGTYTNSSVQYLDWTHGTCYTADLGGEIMPAAGIKVTFGAYQNDTATSDTKLYVGFWWLK